jgi:hypothetical protein
VYLTVPNLFAEDGQFIFQNLQDHGLSAIFKPLNGYPIVGVYILGAFGSVPAHFLRDYSINTIPLLFSLTSYAFWTLVAMSPIRYLKNYLQKRNLYILAILLSLTSIKGWEYSVLGTLAGLKFTFFVLAFVLAIGFNSKPKSVSNLEIYLVLCICIFTNPMSALVIPLLVNKFLFEKKLKLSQKIKQEIIPVSILLLASVVIYLNSQNFEFPPGYMDQPFTAQGKLEALTSRTFGFALFSNLYKYMSEFDSIIIFLVLLTLYSLRRELLPIRNILLATLIVPLTYSYLLLNSRPGLASFYNNHLDAGPGQFFSPQNSIFLLGIFLAISKIWESSKSDVLLKKFCNPLIFILIWILLNFQSFGSLGYGATANHHITVGSLHSNLVKACKNETPEIDVRILPTEGWNIHILRNKYCKRFQL